MLKSEMESIVPKHEVPLIVVVEGKKKRQDSIVEAALCLVPNRHTAQSCLLLTTHGG